MFCADILNVISSYSTNRSISRLLSTSKESWSKRNEVFFYQDWHITGGDKHKWCFSRMKSVSTDGAIPPRVENLTFWDIKESLFDGTMSRIPNTVKNLIFRINIPLKDIENGVIPSTVKSVHFLQDSCERIVGIPEGVEKLILSYWPKRGCAKRGYPHPGDIPNSVKLLKLGIYCEDFLQAGVIPETIKRLNLRFAIPKPSIRERYLPKSLTHLTINGPVCWVPNSVTHLTTTVYSSSSAPVFPQMSSITHLTVYGIITGGFARYIPKSVRHLKIGDIFRRELLPRDLPDFITHLTFEGMHCRRLTVGSIPASVTHLKIKSYMHIYSTEIPETVAQITLESSEIEIIGDLPEKTVVIRKYHTV